MGEKYNTVKRVIGGVFRSTPSIAQDGQAVNARWGETGQLYVIGDGCTIRFRPQAGKGQALTIGGASTRSSALTVGKRHWIWSTQDVWIVPGDSSVVCTTSDFPLPARAVAEYIPSGDDNKYIAIIQLDQVGKVYIGQSSE